MKKTIRTFEFKAPDGTILKRRSRTRVYTHAIIYKSDDKWIIGSCVGRPDLVAARLEVWGRGSLDCIAVEAEK